jgi:hypothetical protein
MSSVAANICLQMGSLKLLSNVGQVANWDTLGLSCLACSPPYCLLPDSISETQMVTPGEAKGVSLFLEGLLGVSFGLTPS